MAIVTVILVQSQDTKLYKKVLSVRFERLGLRPPDPLTPGFRYQEWRGGPAQKKTAGDSGLKK